MHVRNLESGMGSTFALPSLCESDGCIDADLMPYIAADLRILIRRKRASWRAGTQPCAQQVQCQDVACKLGSAHFSSSNTLEGLNCSSICSLVPF